jgi:uncharacterized cofD-like protein
MKNVKPVQLVNAGKTPAILPKVVVIGGGTGSFTLLRALKEQPCDITALVSMSDSGGSTGILRDELGVLPPGDIRQCLVALSEAPELRDLFSFRFPKGSFKGHSFGNLFLSALEKMSGSFSGAVLMASEVLRIKGVVLPITLDKTDLILVRPNGKEIKGEAKIADAKFEANTIPELRLDPEGYITAEARTAILQADLVVIAPGNLYTSLAPALIVNGTKEALTQTKAPIAYVANLVNKPHQTSGYKVHDFAREIERFIGKNNLDYVLYNVDKPTVDQLDAYALEGETPVEIDEKALKAAPYSSVAGNFLSKLFAQSAGKDNSPIKHSFIRHDALAVSEALMQLVPKRAQPTAPKISVKNYKLI